LAQTVVLRCIQRAIDELIDEPVDDDRKGVPI